MCGLRFMITLLKVTVCQFTLENKLKGARNVAVFTVNFQFAL